MYSCTWSDLKQYCLNKQYDKIDKLLPERRNINFVGWLAEKAIELDDLRLVEILFKHDPEAVKRKLWSAVSDERTDIVDFLLHHHADATQCLAESCCHKYDDIFDRILPVFLLQRGDINERDFNNPLFTACKYGSLSKINKLYLHGVDINVVDENGRNGLFYCFNQPESLKLLINYGIKMIPDNKGIYPYELSNSQSCTDILRNIDYQ